MKVSELIRLLPIVSENVMEEAARQPQLFVHVARYRVGRMRRLSQLRARMEYLSSRIAQATRGRVKERGGRITEAQIKERVRIDRRMRRLQSRLDLIEAQDEFAKLLLEAFRMRRDALRIIGEGQIAEGRRESGEVERIEARRRMIREARRIQDRVPVGVRHKTEEK